MYYEYLCVDGKSRLSAMAEVRAALYESSAEALSRDDPRNSTAVRYAVKIVENAVKWNCKRVFASMYQMALAVRVCFMHADNGAVPAELRQVSDKFKNDEVDAILQEHAVWCGTQIESICDGVEDANSDFLLRAEQVVGCVGVVERRDWVVYFC